VRRGVAFAGFVLGAASVGVIAVAMQPTPDDDRQRPAVAAVGGVPAGREMPADAAAEQLRRWSAASLARPLFVPDRRPIAAPAAAGPAATATMPRLSGIMITPAGSRAIFGASGGGKPVVVAEGGSVGGYLVQSISIGEVVLIGPDGRHSLHPSFDATPAKAATP